MGNRKGFRVPTYHELASLVDLGYSNPTLTDTGSSFSERSECNLLVGYFQAPR